MTVGLKVDFLCFPIGTGDFVHAFFSTVCKNLENGSWGSRFPLIMKQLYRGKLKYKAVPKAKDELLLIQSGLKEYAPRYVVWDIDDPEKLPPWGNNISDDITDLSNYFVTCGGEELLEVMLNAFKEAADKKQDVVLQLL